MEALYVVLGLLLGIALAEAIQGRMGRTGERRRILGFRRRSPAAQSAGGATSTSRFTAQDYYDR